MTGQRITFDQDADGFDLDTVDEFTDSGFVHFEMVTDTTAYMTVADETFRLRVELVSRAERREVLRRESDRLTDHLRSVLPWSGSMWSIPVYRRPVSAVRSWWEARRYASVALRVEVDR